MALVLMAQSRVIVQGITGSEGRKHGSPHDRGGQRPSSAAPTRARPASTVDLGGTTVPVFGTVGEAIAETGADVSVVFVPPAGTKDAGGIEAVDAAIPLVIVITEGIPVHDTALFWAYAPCAATPPASSARTVLASPRLANPTPASSRPTSPRRAGSGWCPSRGR